MRPQLWVLAGPNGAGKSTLTARHIVGRIPIVNPDVIALTLPRDISESARIIAAGRSAVSEREALLAAGQSFAVETTLTGHSELTLMRKAASQGFKVNLIYIGLRDVLSSIGRVRERVARGGHNVPMQDLLRRFGRSQANLRQAMPLSDRIILFDGSGKRHRMILSREHGRTKYISSDLPDWLHAIENPP